MNPAKVNEKNSRTFYRGIFAARLEVCFILMVMVRIRFNSSITGCSEGGIAESSAFTVLLW
jgi:hypothetical protein